jgi:hypothetical protein
MGVINSIKNLPPVETVFKAPTYEEMKSMLMAYLNPESGQPGVKEPDMQASQTPPSVSQPVHQPSASTNAVNAFEQLFSQKPS